jgi:epsilon-lactone hydrolase
MLSPLYALVSLLLVTAGIVFWLVGILWLVSVVYLKGEELAAFDQHTGDFFATGPIDIAETAAVVSGMEKHGKALRRLPRSQRLAAMRLYMDNLFADRKFDASFIPVDCAGVPGEWVIGRGADPARRTLYLHGGAFMMGSPRSHRTLTTRFSEISGGAVLAIDYRLMPEHRRSACIQDSRTAYRWMLEHGPNGRKPPQVVIVAGDSAGGNLTLSLIAWVRDQRLRAPDAAIALSPGTDSTGASPSMTANLDSDPILGPLFRPLAKAPRTLVLWFVWLHNRINPRHPSISPVYGDLSRLPPVLIQASASEILYDDSRRYVNRARAAGSPARLQTWDQMIHVWQIFNPELTAARAALDEIRKFLEASAQQQSR